MQKKVVNLSTGTVETVDLTAEEITAREAMQPTPEELLQQQRAAMVLTPAQARLKLAGLGLLEQINTSINALADTDALKIKWEYATQIERLDPDLIEFMVQNMGFTETAIDALFTD